MSNNTFWWIALYALLLLVGAGFALLYFIQSSAELNALLNYFI